MLRVRRVLPPIRQVSARPPTLTGWRHSRTEIQRHGYATLTEQSKSSSSLHIHGTIAQEFGSKDAQYGTESIALSLPYKYWADHLQDDAATYLLSSLQRAYRLNSTTGIAERWEQVKSAGETLPMQGPIANEVWKLLLQDIQLHEELFKHALAVKGQSGILFDRFYEYLMTRLFAQIVPGSEDHDLVLKWHDRFLHEYFIRPGAMNMLATAAKASKSNLRLFRQIYRRGGSLPRQGVYDQIVPELCGLKEWRLALDWHFFLYSQGDFPKDSSFFKQTFSRRPSLEEALAEFNPALNGEILENKPADPKTWTPIDGESPLDADNLELLSSSEEVTKDAKRHAPLSDDFCARLLATKSMSVLAVIRTLEMFEHTKLGPVALRELMARANGLDEATEFLQLFEEAKISVGSSMYPRVVKYFVATRQWDLLENLVHSDLHPDTLSDRILQEQLLEYYVSKGEHLSGKRTVEILKLLKTHLSKSQGENGLVKQPDTTVPSTSQSAKLHRRLHVLSATESRPELQILIDDMIVQAVPLHEKSLSVMATTLFSLDKADRSSTEFYSFGPNVCVRLLKSGQRLNNAVWTKTIEFLGSMGRESDLFILFSYFVRQHYGKPLRAELSNRLGQESDRLTSAVEEISSYLSESSADNHSARFCLHHLTGGIIAWGFRSALPRLLADGQLANGPAPVFLSGLRFLSELQKQGFQPNRSVLASTVRSRLLLLYGLRHLESRKHVIVKRHNPFVLEELLFHIEQVWSGSRLFPELYNKPNASPVSHPNIEPPLSNRPNATSPDLPTETAEKPHKSTCLPPKPHMKSWKHSDYHTLAQQNSGCILDGLSKATTARGTPPLSRDVRIKRRIDLRYRILGATPDRKSDGLDTTVTQEAWDTYIRNSAIMADRILVSRGLVCSTEADAEL